MKTLKLHKEYYLIILTLLTFTVGLSIVNLAEDQIIFFGLLLIVASTLLSLISFLSVIELRHVKILKRLVLSAVVLTPAIFTITYIIMAKD